MSVNNHGLLWNPPEQLQPKLELSHPRLYYNPANLMQLSRNLSATGPAWAKRVYNDVCAAADAVRFRNMGDAEIRALLPPPGAFFMYGYRNLCPNGTPMTVSWEHPGYVSCADGHLLPDADHPDSGTGWIDPIGGKTYYFKARWYGFVVEEMTKALEPLAYAYVVSGDTCYAHVAAVILDVLASMYPMAIEGPLDYPGLRPGREGGRLERPYYQVARHLVYYANATDLIWNSGELDVPSPTNPAVSIKENIAFNMLLNGGDYCYRQATGPAFRHHLNNGTADYNRGALAVGSMLGISKWVDWILQGPTNIRYMLTNCVDRDGNYYETSNNYSEHTRYLYHNTAEMLYNLRTPEYPEGVNLYNQDRLTGFLVGAKPKLMIAGRTPAYGDTATDDKCMVKAGFDTTAFNQAICCFTRMAESDEKQRVACEISELAQGEPVQRLNSAWALLNVTAIPSAIYHSTKDEKSVELCDGKGIAILRSGCGNGVMLRYGASLNHGQKDEMAILVYGQGREASFDPGYGVTEYGLGWQHQTLAHLTVVVDEMSQLSPDSAGGSLNFIAGGAGLSVVDAADEPAYANVGVDQYRRCTAIVPTGTGSHYIFDMFRVAGGKLRDYSFHARGRTFSTTGLALSAPVDVSLAGPSCAWGDSVRPNYSLIGCDDKPYQWIPPPENGYGFLMRPRFAAGSDVWSAEWAAEDTKTRITMLPAPERMIVVADGPNLMGVKYVLARDAGSLPSTYAAVIETTTDTYPVTAVEPMEVTAGLDDTAPVAGVVKVGGTQLRDIFLSTLSGGVFTATHDGKSYATDAEFAMVREDAAGVVSIDMVKGTTFTCESLTVSGMERALSGCITKVDYAAASVLVGSERPLSSTLVGQYVIFTRDTYSHASAYQINRVEPVGDDFKLYLDPAKLCLARGRLDDKDPEGNVLPNSVNLPYTRNVLKKGANKYYNGKLITGAANVATCVEKVLDDFAALQVGCADGFTAGAEFAIWDLQPGDMFTIPSVLHLSRTGAGEGKNDYTVVANVPFQIH